MTFDAFRRLVAIAGPARDHLGRALEPCLRNDAAAGVVEFATACGEATQNVTGVHEASRQIVRGASQIETVATELSKISAQLRTVVGHFQLENSIP